MNSRETYNTPMTFLVIDWNSSSVYSRVGNGASLILEGLNCIHGTLRKDGASEEWREVPLPDCWAAKIIKESKICWSCSSRTTFPKNTYQMAKQEIKVVFMGRGYSASNNYFRSSHDQCKKYFKHSISAHRDCCGYLL